MARPVNPKAQFTVKPHFTNGYTYASTQPPYIDPKTGKKVYRRIHWGVVDENLRFTPGTQFYKATAQERARLIFPKNWDMSKAAALLGLTKEKLPLYDPHSQNLLYGDIWLLEQIAMKTKIRENLEEIFEDHELASDVLTLAIHPYLTNNTFNHLARWQRVAKTPSTRELTPLVIDKITKSITEQNFFDLLKLRSLRLGPEKLCCVQSASWPNNAINQADILPGQNTDCQNTQSLRLAHTAEVVVYSLESHMPVYYRALPGYIPEGKRLDIILKDLENSGFKNPSSNLNSNKNTNPNLNMILVTDGENKSSYDSSYDSNYYSKPNLEQLILGHKSMIMPINTSQKNVTMAINDLGNFKIHPDSMEYDLNKKIHYKQIDLDYYFDSKGHKTKADNKLKLNLYFDQKRRKSDLKEFDLYLDTQESYLAELLASNSQLSDDNLIIKDFMYYSLDYDPETRVLIDYKLNKNKVAKAKIYPGFFALITTGLDFEAMKTYDIYSLRDEQEKYFHQIKPNIYLDRQKNWSYEGKNGRLFILFVSLILSSHLRHVWQSSALYHKYSSPTDILDEMRSIRYIESANKEKVITPFDGSQLDVCKAFGIDVPRV
ncbi:MAG: hypothetical protein LBE31_04565 [Deltaproteobacteria bacterium]|jgi:hypothetical protein|nr:hypothetical protein [Deltaproteobacteria bacterium]